MAEEVAAATSQLVCKQQSHATQKRKERRSCHWTRQWYPAMSIFVIIYYWSTSCYWAAQERKGVNAKKHPVCYVFALQCHITFSDFLTDLLKRLHDDTNQVAIKIALEVSTLVVAKMRVVCVNFLALRFCWVTLSQYPLRQYPLFYNAWCLCHVKRTAKRKSFVCTNCRVYNFNLIWLLKCQVSTIKQFKKLSNHIWRVPNIHEYLTKNEEGPYN
jgi:hypothetical protein